MATAVIQLKSLATAAATNIALSQSPGATSALTLNGAAVSGGIATIDTASATNVALGRRVILTSGGNDTGITWTVIGKNLTGNAITDSFAGANGGAAQSNLDFVTVSSITHTGSVATTVTAGTNGVGSSPWLFWNWRGKSPINLAVAVELVSGSVNYTVQYTYDDPNSLPSGVAYPLAFDMPVLTGASATSDGLLIMPCVGTRVIINSGTGVLRVRWVQAGIG